MGYSMDIAQVLNVVENSSLLDSAHARKLQLDQRQLETVIALGLGYTRLPNVSAFPDLFQSRWLRAL